MDSYSFKTFMEATAGAFDLNAFLQQIPAYFPEPHWQEGDCFAFARALTRFLRSKGLQADIVHAADVHSVVRVDGRLVDSQGVMLDNRVRYWVKMIRQVNVYQKQSAPDAVMFPLGFVTADQLPFNPWSKDSFEDFHPGAERTALRRFAAIDRGNTGFRPRGLKRPS